jgi:hypothetical protein
MLKFVLERLFRLLVDISCKVFLSLFTWRPPLKKRKPKTTLFDAQSFLTGAIDAYRRDLESKDPMYAASFRQVWLDSFSKKYILPADKEKLRNNAIAKFLSVNDEMSKYSIISSDDLNPLLRNIVTIARAICTTVLGEVIDMEDIFRGCKNSSGASVGVSYKDTSIEAKVSFPITVTESAYPHYMAYLRYDKEYLRAIVDLNQNSENPFLKFVGGSKAATVPKTSETDRFIAVEPTANMFIQQGVANAMHRKMLLECGLSLKRDPERHRRLAYYGSISNNLCTIDFSSMSDRVSIGVVHLLLPKQWAALLMDIRSPQTLIGSSWVTNHMISSMGNATTFPLETLILWALAIATHLYNDGHTIADLRDLRKWWSYCSVFGDDVIMLTRDAPLFLNVCQGLGFVPNLDKTFYKDEFFRESCGGDFLHGRDVRPLFLKAFPSPRSRIACEAHLYTLINRTISKYIQYFGPLSYVYDKSLLRYLFRCLSSCTDSVKFVPEYFPEDSGICFLSDLHRLTRCYSVKRVSPLLIDKHGGISFRYLSFKYRSLPVFDGIRYAVKLKLLSLKFGAPRPPVFQTDRDVDTERTTREFGKYVVKTVGTGCPIHGYSFLTVSRRSGI